MKRILILIILLISASLAHAQRIIDATGGGMSDEEACSADSNGDGLKLATPPPLQAPWLTPGHEPVTRPSATTAPDARARESGSGISKLRDLFRGNHN